ncbi:MAG: tRNA-dihydrouridine synthase family protein [Treponema sp.]|nr:tRNA-dihydrouridine synthase family protein [Spirochaetales bacterium]MDY6189581.1 tRNA-dihydrouridine synthase family protein [Treponema sp.]
MKLICGPMATISHPAFRMLIEKFGGCDEYFTEMINAGTLLVNGPFEKYYINPAPVPQKVVWQLTGNDKEKMTEAARILLNLEGIGIDINMGCSAPEIYKHQAGIAWMLKDKNETAKMVRSVAEQVQSYNSQHENKKRLSVKLRLGNDDFTDELFLSFCDMLVDEGVELFTLHPRTKKEKLTRPPRYEYCQKIAERYKNQKVKVYLNGKVSDWNSFNDALIKAPDVDGVMISTAAVQKPWIFAQLKKQNLEPVNMKQIALQFIDEIEKFQPPEFWKTRLQRFFTYFSRNFKFSHYAQTQFLNAQNNDDLRERIIDFFNKCPDEKIKIINT